MIKFVWMDMETTGFDPFKDKILEIAVIITDTDLNLIEEFEPITLGYDLDNLEFALVGDVDKLMNDFEESGLFDRVRESDIELDTAEERLSSYIKKHCEKNKCNLAGSSVWFDANFLINQLPEVWDYLHYKLLDVTALKVLRAEWYPEVEEYPKADTHDALTDIKESIEQLKHYRKTIFKQAANSD